MMECMYVAVGGVFLGVFLGRAANVATTGLVRSLAKTAIKGGLLAGKVVQTAVHQAREGISDMAAEAKADLAKKM